MMRVYRTGAIGTGAGSLQHNNNIISSRCDEEAEYRNALTYEENKHVPPVT